MWSIVVGTKNSFATYWRKDYHSGEKPVSHCTELIIIDCKFIVLSLIHIHIILPSGHTHNNYLIIIIIIIILDELLRRG